MNRTGASAIEGDDTGAFDIFTRMDSDGCLRRAAFRGVSRGIDALARRWRKARRTGRDLEHAEVERRHELRKELKKLRYGVEFFETLFPKKRVANFRKRLKKLQKSFGALNDAAVAEAMFAGPGAPCADDPAAQRAVGRLLGTLAREADDRWGETLAAWRALESEPPFWR